MQVAAKRIPVGREAGEAFVWLQHEMQRKIESIIAVTQGCDHICSILGHCLKNRELYIVMRMYPSSLESVLEYQASTGAISAQPGLNHAR